MPRKKKAEEAKVESKIIYGFVKHFLYHDNNSLYSMGGHPKVGRVYRIIKDSEQAYRLHIGVENNIAHHEGLLLNGLKGNWPNWECEIVEITADNFTDFTLEDEDSEKLNQWIDTNNADLTEHVNPKSVKTHTASEIMELLTNLPVIAKTYPTIESPADIHEGMTLSMSDEAIHLATVADNIKDKDPEQFKALVHLLLYINSCFADKYEKGEFPNLGKAITQSTTLGKGANIFSTVKYIQRYSTAGFDKSENSEDLLKAIHYILFELMRTKPWLKKELN